MKAKKSSVERPVTVNVELTRHNEIIRLDEAIGGTGVGEESFPFRKIEPVPGTTLNWTLNGEILFHVPIRSFEFYDRNKNRSPLLNHRSDWGTILFYDLAKVKKVLAPTKIGKRSKR